MKRMLKRCVQCSKRLRTKYSLRQTRREYVKMERYICWACYANRDVYTIPMKGVVR